MLVDFNIFLCCAASAHSPASNQDQLPVKFPLFVYVVVFSVCYVQCTCTMYYIYSTGMIQRLCTNPIRDLEHMLCMGKQHIAEQQLTSVCVCVYQH